MLSFHNHVASKQAQNDTTATEGKHFLLTCKLLMAADGQFWPQQMPETFGVRKKVHSFCFSGSRIG